MRRDARARRTGAAVVLVALGVGGLVACGDSPEAEVAAVTVEDLRELENDVAALEERVAELEGAPLSPAETVAPAPPSTAADDRQDFLGAPNSFLDEDVTVRAEITGPLTVTGIGSAFRLRNGSGNSVPVVSATPTDTVGVGDVVEVSGTAVRVQRNTFEQEFGIAADELLGNPNRWFRENEGEVAISADEITVVQEETDR